MRSSPDSLLCASWLVYATRATNEPAKRVKNIILQVKTDRHLPSGAPIVRMVVERAVAQLDADARLTFAGDPLLVPVPGSGLTKPNSVWPARRICEELVRQGLGDDVVPVISRDRAVPKSAGSLERPRLEQHVESLVIQPGFVPPNRLLVVDDVVTSGTTIMACAVKLAQTFPGVPISGFALARVQSEGNPDRVFEPAVERVIKDGQRCKRVPRSEASEKKRP